MYWSLKLKRYIKFIDITPTKISMSLVNNADSIIINNKINNPIKTYDIPIDLRK